jgi:hypothetical protein
MALPMPQTPLEAFTWKAIRVSGGIAVGLAVLLVSARLLRIEEFDEARSRVVRRLLRR